MKRTRSGRESAILAELADAQVHGAPLLLRERALEGHCTCDDPGLKGFMIGAPIGAATGVTLGIVLTR